jgi:hypothetical protein
MPERRLPLAEAPLDPVAGLVDIPLPQAVSLWPQTWTARLVIAAALAAIIVSVWTLARRRYQNRYRREALAEIDRIAADETPDVGQLAMLVRRTALAAFPREQVAALDGPDWLAFLDRSCGGSEFSQGKGRILAAAPYQPAAAVDLPELIGLVRRWIKVHHA